MLHFYLVLGFLFCGGEAFLYLSRRLSLTTPRLLVIIIGAFFRLFQSFAFELLPIAVILRAIMRLSLSKLRILLAVRGLFPRALRHTYSMAQPRSAALWSEPHRAQGMARQYADLAKLSFAQAFPGVRELYLARRMRGCKSLRWESTQALPLVEVLLAARSHNALLRRIRAARSQ